MYRRNSYTAIALGLKLAPQWSRRGQATPTQRACHHCAAALRLIVFTLVEAIQSST